MTGATGNMGYETLRMLTNPETSQYNLRLLVLPDKLSKKRIKPYLEQDNITIIWGDVTQYEDVLAGVTDADYVLHAGALIPPASDYKPELTRKVNYGGTLNIIKAIKSQPNADSIRLVFIGTVAEVGSRLPPVHWGRVGDPIMISQFDAYAESKVMAERAVIESGLPYWVSLRQTAMLHFNLFNRLDPIVYHHPLNTHMEWVTAADSARILLKICETDNLPEDFWRHVYTIGGGAEFRKTNAEFMESGFRLMGIRNFRRVVNPNWFAAKNFHGCWFLDSDILNSILDYRRDTFDGFFRDAEKSLSFSRRLLRFFTKLMPPFIIKYLVMRPIAAAPHGTLHFLRSNAVEMINAFWGSFSGWLKQPKRWKNILIDRDPPARTVFHGFNEKKDITLLDIDDMSRAAAFRGGKCLSDSMEQGNISAPLTWECSSGHTFTASPRLVLHAGHWCPYCDINSADYSELGNSNSFLGQVIAAGKTKVSAKLAAGSASGKDIVTV